MVWFPTAKVSVIDHAVNAAGFGYLLGVVTLLSDQFHASFREVAGGRWRRPIRPGSRRVRHTGEPQQGGRVEEDADDLGAPFHFPNNPLYRGLGRRRSAYRRAARGVGGNPARAYSPAMWWAATRPAIATVNGSEGAAGGVGLQIPTIGWGRSRRPGRPPPSRPKRIDEIPDNQLGEPGVDSAGQPDVVLALEKSTPVGADAELHSRRRNAAALSIPH